MTKQNLSNSSVLAGRKSLVDFTRKKVEELFADFYVPAHGLDHSERVIKWILVIAQKEGVNPFLAELAGLLHDIGRVPEHKHNPENLRHQELSYLLLKEWFAEYREFDVLSSEEKEELLYAIRYHWEDEKCDYPLAIILRDADKIDLLGEIGVKRASEFHQDVEKRKNNIQKNLSLGALLKTETAREIVREQKLLEPLENFLKDN